MPVYDSASQVQEEDQPYVNELISNLGEAMHQAHSKQVKALEDLHELIPILVLPVAHTYSVWTIHDSQEQGVVFRALGGATPIFGDVVLVPYPHAGTVLAIGEANRKGFKKGATVWEKS